VVSRVRIAVVGVGPRGLSVLERVISHARSEGPPIELLLIEPGELGAGIHAPEQPDYLLLNTIASQLTIFSDEQMTPGAPVTVGPSFFDWCRARRSSVRFDDFLPRALLGKYLQWAARDLLSRTPARLQVHHLRTVALRVRPHGPGASVTLVNGTELHVDLAVVTTGHGLTAPEAADEVVGTPYPLPDRVAAIPAGATVALRGIGLTSIDVIAALTVGRGGSFVDGRYLPSGAEPRIVLVNRCGWLPCARPVTPPDRRPAQPVHLTHAAITELRAAAVHGRLDFRRDIEPLVHREALARMTSATAREINAVERVLHPAEDSWPGYMQYTAALVDRARADLREAERGLGVSPVKEALEVLRDHREMLRAVVDPPGLTAGSHRYFVADYVPLVNRAVIGPQKERMHELLTLIAAGVVLPGPGPRPELARTPTAWTLASTRLRRPHRIAVDMVIEANLGGRTAVHGRDPVADSLRTWIGRHPGGHPLLDRDGFAVPSRGAAGPCAVAVLGPPAEGASYYNHYVPSPGVWSRVLTDLDRVLGRAIGVAPPAVRLP
jgi:FAD-NAD(P)-binding